MPPHIDKVIVSSDAALTKKYLAAYPDVGDGHHDPLEHYLVAGIHEHRSTFADGIWS